MISLWRRVFAERRSVLVPLVVLLILDAILLGAVVVPLKKVVANERVSATEDDFSSALATQRLKQIQGARTSRDRAEKELAKFYGQVLPSSQATAGSVLMLEIAKLAKENNLTLGPRGWDEDIVKDSPLRRLTTKVELLGDYGAVLHFIYDVETSEAFLAIRSVQLSQATRQQANNTQLQLTLEIVTYYRTTTTAAAK